MDPDFLNGTPDQLRFLSAREAPELLRRMRDDGPAYHKLARKVVNCRDALIEWIEKFRRASTHQASTTQRRPAGTRRRVS